MTLSNKILNENMDKEEILIVNLYLNLYLNLNLILILT